jgi:hypothetical protein
VAPERNLHIGSELWKESKTLEILEISQNKFPSKTRMISSLLTLVAAVVSPLILAYYWKGLALSRRTGIPWISLIPFITNANIHDPLIQLSKKHGPVLLQYVGVMNVFVCDVETTKFVLKEETTIIKDAPPSTASILKLFDTNLVFSDGDIYKKHKACIEPFFKSESLRQFSVVFLDKSRLVADRLKEKSEHEEVDVLEWMTRFTVATPFSLLFFFFSSFFPPFSPNRPFPLRLMSLGLPSSELTFRLWRAT